MLVGLVWSFCSSFFFPTLYSYLMKFFYYFSSFGSISGFTFFLICSNYLPKETLKLKKNAPYSDHGITSATSPLLLSRLATNGTLLTICPLSNVSLKVFSRISDLPIRAFLDARVPFSINSDDPAYFGGYIQENYCAVQEAFGMSMGEWEKIVKNAVQKSWCGEERKAEILHEVDEVFGEHGWGGQGIVLPN